MDSPTFLSEIYEKRGEPEHPNLLRILRLVGTASVASTDVRVGICCFEWQPRPGETIVRQWGILTASVDPADEQCHWLVTADEQTKGQEIAHIPVGESPWLPDEARIGIARNGELPPAVYIPATEAYFLQRSLIEPAPDGPAEI